MRFHWTIEPFGYALRDSNGRARGMVTQPAVGQGFYGVIFQRDLPDAGPYKNRQDAADWVAGILVKLGAAPADSVFTPLPPWVQLTYDEIFAA